VKAQLEKLIDKLKMGNRQDFPELIDNQYQIVGNIDNVSPTKWDNLKRHYKAHICRTGKQPYLSENDFIAYIKLSLTKKQAYNKNLTATLSKYRNESERNQIEKAQDFLNQFRVYTGQPTFDEQYRRGVQFLRNFRKKRNENHTIDIQQKNEIIFGYLLNQVRLWFIEKYADNVVPTLDRQWLEQKIAHINDDESFWKEYGASQQLVDSIYDRINNLSAAREKPQKLLEEAISSSVNAVVLHGAAGSGKSVLAKYCWKQWRGTKFFIDLHQDNASGRMSNIAKLLKKLPRTLIIIDRGERITNIDVWTKFIHLCVKNNHQVLFVTRESALTQLIGADVQIESPEFSDDDISALALPKFITDEHRLIELCRLPFFCRLAFDVDSRRLDEINQQAFVELAIQGVYSTEKEKKQNSLIWHALCLDMVKSQQSRHGPIWPRKELKAMPAFKILENREILLINNEEKVSFMHDIFFEVGLESFLTLSLENSILNNTLSLFGQQLALYFTRLPQYNVSLLLPWFHQHSQEIMQLYYKPTEFPLANFSDYHKKLILALLVRDDTNLFMNTFNSEEEQINPLFGGKATSLVALSLFFRNTAAFKVLSDRIINSITEQTLKKCFKSLSYWKSPAFEVDPQFLKELMLWVNTIWINHSQKSKEISPSVFVYGIKLLSTELISFDFLRDCQHGTDWIDGHYPITYEQFTTDKTCEHSKVYYRSLATKWSKWFFNQANNSNQEDNYALLTSFISQLMAVINSDHGLECISEKDIVDHLSESECQILESLDPEEITRFFDDANLSNKNLCDVFFDQIQAGFDTLRGSDLQVAFSFILSDPWNLDLFAVLDKLDLDDEDLKWLLDNGYKKEMKKYFANKGSYREFFPEFLEEREMLIESSEFVFMCSESYIRINLNKILKELKQLGDTRSIDIIKNHFDLSQSNDSDYSAGSNRNGLFSSSSSWSDASMSDTEKEEKNSLIEYDLDLSC
jgi:hypothetical protein